MYAEKLFEIGGIGPNLYGIMIAVGLICCFAVLAIFGKKVGMSKASLDFYEMTGLFAVILGFLSAMAFQWVYDSIKYGSVADFGNMTFLGGLIGGVVVFCGITAIWGKPEVKKDFIKFLQVGMPCVLIAHAFGRIGCFFAGCCYGVHTDSAIGIEFPDGGSHGTVVPTQLIEAIFLFIVFGLTILFIYKKIPYNVVTYLISYSVFRFVLEFFRGDNRGTNIIGLSPSQFWSLIMFIFGGLLLTLMLLYKYRKDKVPKPLLKIASGFCEMFENKNVKNNDSDIITKKTGA